MRDLVRTTQVLFLFTALALAGGCGSGGGGSGGGTAPSAQAPIFAGVQSIATAGGAFVRLDWEPAVDDGGGTIVYRVYVAPTSGGQNFSSPTVSTGATSVILDGASTPSVSIGSTVFVVVRAVDADGNEDQNTVELHAMPVSSTNVAFVSDTAGGTGTLGDPTDPFPTIQAGVDAVHAATSGIVLVDADVGGTVYAPAASLDLSVGVTTIGMFGGFARFSTLPAGASGGHVLVSRSVSTRPTTISGMASFPAQLINVANSLSPTYIDGFTFDGTRTTTSALTGTLTFQQGRTLVTGEGTLFAAEIGGSGVIQLTPGGPCVNVAFVDSDTRLILSAAYPGPSASGSGATLGPTVRALTATDADLQFSGNRLLCGCNLFADTSAITIESRLSIIGNEALHVGPDAFQIGGGIASLRFEGNHVEQRGQALVAGDSTSSRVNVPTAGCSIQITNNLLEDNQVTGSGPMVSLGFAPSAPASGGTLNLLVEGNEIRNNSGNAFDFDHLGDVGAGGSSVFTMRGNLCNGPSQDGIEFTTIAGDPFPGVDMTINVLDNVITNTDSIGLDAEIGVAPGRTTVLNIEDNLLAVGESEMIELTDEEPGGANASDQGVMEIGIHRNVGQGGLEDLECEIGVAAGGRTGLTLTQNTVLSSEDMGMNLDLENHIGGGAGTFPFPNGVYCFNLFNNDVEGHDDEGVEIEDTRGNDDILAVGYIGNNFIHSGADGNDGALDFQVESDDGGWLVRRSVFGMGGSEGTEAGIEYDTASDDIRNDVLIVNCMVTLASGGGFEFDTDGAQVQCINNTAAYNGINGNDNSNFENDASGSTLGDGQVYILNCIGSHAGGEHGDFDIIGGFRPHYSLARDGGIVGGIGNLSGDPFYLTDITDLPFPITNQSFSSLYTLRPTSPAVDAGHPDPAFNDPDGSRNDMGAYGGPGAGTLGTLAAGTQLPFEYVSTFPSVTLPSGGMLVADGGHDLVRVHPACRSSHAGCDLHHERRHACAGDAVDDGGWPPGPVRAGHGPHAWGFGLRRGVLRRGAWLHHRTDARPADVDPLPGPADERGRGGAQ